MDSQNKCTRRREASGYHPLPGRGFMKSLGISGQGTIGAARFRQQSNQAPYHAPPLHGALQQAAHTARRHAAQRLRCSEVCAFLCVPPLSV